MTGRASRPIVTSVTDTGVVYCPIARGRQIITVNVTAGGLTGVAVDWTNDNIIRGPASSYDVNNEEFVAAASALWEVLQANAITTAIVGAPLQAFALRFTGTGTGTARIVVTQSEE